MLICPRKPDKPTDRQITFLIPFGGSARKPEPYTKTALYAQKNRETEFQAI